MNTEKIPLPTVRRLSLYKRFLEKLRELRIRSTSSTPIGEYTGIPAYQVRKDLNHLGGIGKAGKGYDVRKLIESISQALRSDIPRKCVVVGLGRLGSAITGFLCERQKQFKVVAGFDTDKEKVGQSVFCVRVLHADELSRVVREKNVDVAILTVPSAVAQQTAEELESAGIKGILNFTPVKLSLPENMVVSSIDFSQELEIISYLLSNPC